MASVRFNADIHMRERVLKEAKRLGLWSLAASLRADLDDAKSEQQMTRHIWNEFEARFRIPYFWLGADAEG
jgi:hypothetical protein